jgi:hypothetical protein
MNGSPWGERGAAIVCAAGLAAGLFAAGCVGETSANDEPASGGGLAYSSSSGGAGGPSTQPMLAVIDTDESLNETGGQGVGIFTQYAAGGHWTVRWTCDTSLTNLSCAFLIRVTLTSAPSTPEGGAPAITNLGNQITSSNASLSQGSDADIVAATTTYTGLDGITFDTPPGATITLEASVDGDDNGSFLFFVQDGKVNGGYQGTLSDPIMFVPSSP